ncbi:MAG: hypothetical protein ACI82Z_000160 [Cellvibrionaceae bacterium]|jgi:hypothetical protein
MSKYYIYSFLVLSVTAILSLVAYFSFSPKPETLRNPVYDNNVYLRYGFLLKSQSNHVIENAKFSMFAPHQRNEKQKLIAHTSNQPSELVMDENGNYSFELSDLLIPPFGSKTLTITMEVASATHQVEMEANDLDFYLENTLYLNMDHPSLIQLAQQFGGQDQNQIAKNIYVWLINNVQVLNYVAQAKGAKYAVEQRKGDCTEMMHAFMALARLNNIPTRAVGGFVVEGKSTVVHANDYHNWAEYYDGKRWVIVDAQKQIFDKTGSLTYVSFRYLDQKNQHQRYTQRFITFDENIGVSML